MHNAFLAALLQGFGLGAGLIIAIGAQNAFVLRQGLKKQQLFLTAAICTLCDALLISLGTAGVGTLIASTPVLTTIATWGGTLFLLYYSFRSFRSALHPGTLDTGPEQTGRPNTRTTILMVLALSLLNPHAILDTVVLVGSVGAHYPGQTRIFFALGAVFASFTWFFSLSYGAGWLAPLFQRPLAWRMLDVLVGCVMWMIAISLLLSTFK